MYIHVREGLASAVQEDVRSGLADFGIGSAAPSHAGITTESMHTQATIKFKDIAHEPMISMPTDSGLRRTIDTAANAQGLVLNHNIITSQYGSLYDIIALKH